MHVGRFEAVDLDYDFEKTERKTNSFQTLFSKKKERKKEKKLKKKGLTKTWSTIFYQHDLLCHTVDASLISAQVKFACCATDYWHQ